MKSFAVIWFGQILSALGSGLTTFALGIWVYQQSGSVTAYSLFSLAAMLPAILVAPVAGIAVDRFNRKNVLISADLIGAAAISVAIFLYFTDRLAVASIFIICFGVAVCEVFTFLSLSAAMTDLVPSRHLGRANGMLHGGHGLAQVAAPAIAGVVVANWGLGPVLSADALSFLAAGLATALIAIPRKGAASNVEAKRSFSADLLFGAKYVLARPGLFALLIYFAVINFGTNFAVVLVTPLILSQGTEAELGTVMSIAGAGMLTGSLLMSVWGGPAQKVPLVLGCGLVFSVIAFVTGSWSTVPVIGACAFVLMVITPILNSASAVIWQTRVPAHLQGRVFAFRTVVATSSAPLAFALAGPLADRFFEPAMAAGGALVPVFSAWFGAGPGRGMGLMIALCGLVPLVATIAGVFSSNLRRVEAETC